METRSLDLGCSGEQDDVSTELTDSGSQATSRRGRIGAVRAGLGAGWTSAAGWAWPVVGRLGPVRSSPPPVSY